MALHPSAAKSVNERVRYAVALHQSDWESEFFRCLAAEFQSRGEFKRCVDATDLVADVLAGLVETVVVDADFAGLDASSVSRMASRVNLVGVCSDLAGESKLRQWGVDSLVLLDADELSQAARAVMGLVLELEAESRADSVAGLDPDGLAGMLVDNRGHEGPGLDARGRIIAVCSLRAGSGVTTVATGLAEALAAQTGSTILVDADLDAPAVADNLALTDDSGGLLRACRLAERGTFAPAELAATSRSLGNSLRLLTGLPAAYRKPEIKSVALTRVLDVAQQLDRRVVVDLGAPWVAASPMLEGVELQYALSAQDPARTAVAQQLTSDDLLVVVVDCSPIAIAQATALIGQLAKVTVEPAIAVVINRMRASVLSSRDLGEVADLIQQTAPAAQTVSIRHDLATADKALLAGQSLREASGRSTVVADLAAAAAQLERSFEFVGASL